MPVVFPEFFHAQYLSWVGYARRLGVPPDSLVTLLIEAALAAQAAPDAAAAAQAGKEAMKRLAVETDPDFAPLADYGLDEIAELFDAANPLASSKWRQWMESRYPRLKRDVSDEPTATRAVAILWRHLWSESTPEEETLLRHWVDERPDGMDFFDAAYECWEANGWRPGFPAPNPEEILQALAPAPSPARGRKLTLKALALLALVLSGSLAWVLWQNKSSPPEVLPDQVWKAEAGLLIVTPEPNARFWLADGSQLSRKGGAYLLQGEARIEWTGPFSVSSLPGDGTISSAQGVAYVRSADRSVVQVFSDTLRLTTPTESFMLQKGQVATWEPAARTWWKRAVPDTLAPVR